MTITSNSFDKVTIHTYTSPEDGAGVNSHIIETIHHLILVDTQFILPYAQEVKNFADSLKKPIAKIIISHDHPDHWFGTTLFPDIPVYAVKEVLTEIQNNGSSALERNKALLGDLIPEQALIPTLILDEGTFELDDISIKVTLVKDTESQYMTVLELPEQRVLIAQDLIYHDSHLFVAQQELLNWKNTLLDFSKKDWQLVLPGHGLPASTEVFDQMINYLDIAQHTLNTVSTFKDYKETIIKEFPDHKLIFLIDLNEPFLNFKSDNPTE